MGNGIGIREEGSRMGRTGREGNGMVESNIRTSEGKGKGALSWDMGASEGSGIGGPGLLSTSPQERRSAPRPVGSDGRERATSAVSR